MDARHWQGQELEEETQHQQPGGDEEARGSPHHMQKVDGTEVSIKYLCPAASLWQTLTGCDRFREHFASALEQHACSMTSKWSIVLYSDEVSPGNQLKSSNKRRLQTF